MKNRITKIILIYIFVTTTIGLVVSIFAAIYSHFPYASIVSIVYIFFQYFAWKKAYYENNNNLLINVLLSQILGFGILGYFIHINVVSQIAPTLIYINGEYNFNINMGVFSFAFSYDNDETDNFYIHFNLIPILFVYLLEKNKINSEVNDNIPSH